MVRIIVIVAALLSAGLGPAAAEHSQQSAPPQAPAPAGAPETPAPINPLDVPRWMGDAIGRILSEEQPAPDTRPIRQ